MANTTLISPPDPVDLFLASHEEAPTLRAPDSATRYRQHVERAEYALRLTRRANTDVARFERNLAQPRVTHELIAYAALFVLLTALAAFAAMGGAL